MAKDDYSSIDRATKKGAGIAARVRRGIILVAAGFMAVFTLVGGVAPLLAGGAADVLGHILLVIGGGSLTIGAIVRRSSDEPGERLAWLGAIVLLILGIILYLGVT